MATISAKEVVVTWDGDPTTWGDYARKVRLQWEKTPDRKKKYLAPDLASRLTGRAWSVTPDLEHSKLSKKNGTKYLLKFLQSRLCRTAVPDAGARLEDLLIRLRRPLGIADEPMVILCPGGLPQGTKGIGQGSTAEETSCDNTGNSCDRERHVRTSG